MKIYQKSKKLSQILLLSILFSTNLSFANNNLENEISTSVSNIRLNNIEDNSSKNYSAHNSWRFSDEKNHALKIKKYIMQNFDIIEKIGSKGNEQLVFVKSINDTIIKTSDNFTSYHFLKNFHKKENLYGYQEMYQETIIYDYKNDGKIDYWGVIIGNSKDFIKNDFSILEQLGIKNNYEQSTLENVLSQIKKINLSEFREKKFSLYVAVRDNGIMGQKEKVSFIEFNSPSYSEYKYDYHYNSLLKQILFQVSENIEKIEIKKQEKNITQSSFITK